MIVDTGPLVALLDRREAHHAWMAAQAEVLPVPWMVCEPVLAEAWYLLRHAPGAQDTLIEMLETGLLRCEFDLADEAGAVRNLCAKYRDVPMSLADACIVRMAELNENHPILTLDSDFTIYRRFGREPLPLISPGVP